MSDTTQNWFREAGFGLFIHFGLYAQLGGEWKGRVTPALGEWILNTLDIPLEEYRALAGTFDPEEFDADRIAGMAVNWGMKYIVITSKHHDGFALFDSDCTDYCMTKATPCHRDLIKEMEQACRSHGLKFGVYYSQAQDWDDPDGYRANHDNTGKNFRAYLDRKCIPQLKELMRKYPGISLVWFDTPMDSTPEESRELIRLVKSLHPGILVSGRIGNGMGDYMTTGDNFIPAAPFPGPWEVPATLNDTWGYKRSDQNWKDPEHVLRLLLKINSRGGNYLLNVGPDGAGRIPQECVSVLDRVGGYVRDNEESVRGTLPVEAYPYDLEWCIFTRKSHRFYIHVMQPAACPEILNFRAEIHKAYVLATKESVGFESGRTCEGTDVLRLSLPETYHARTGYCICLELEEEAPHFESIRK